MNHWTTYIIPALCLAFNMAILVAVLRSAARDPIPPKCDDSAFEPTTKNN